MVREFPCRGCGKPMLLKDSYCYKSKDKSWKKTERDDVANLNPDVINTDSRTDITFYCAECHSKFGKQA